MQIPATDWPPRAPISPIDLPGEPGTDQGYLSTATGRKYRARVTRGAMWTDDKSPADRAPTRVTLIITVAALNDDGSVVDIDGKWRIYDARDFTVGVDDLAKPEFDVNVLIVDNIAILIAGVEAAGEREEEVARQLARWGVDLTTPLTHTDVSTEE